MCPVQAHPVADDGAWCPPEWQGDSGIRRMGLWAPEDATWLQALQGRYQQWRQSKMTLSPDATIPRVLHHIWLGPAPIPARFEEFMARWRTLHPESRGWRHKLWRDADVAALGLRQPYLNARNWGEKSDVARYEILARYGGVYVDVDFEPLRPLDALHEGVGCYVGFSNVGAVEINNGLIAAVPGHKIFTECARRAGYVSARDGVLLDAVLTSGFIGAADATRTLQSYAAADTIARTGPGFFTRVFCECLSVAEDALCLPPTVFYPAPNTNRDRSPRAYATEGSLAVHHWARSWC